METETKKTDDQREGAVFDIKKLDLHSGKFSANGHNYTIQSSIPISRYKQFKRLTIRLVYGMDIKTLLENCLKAYNYCDTASPKPVSAGIILHNIINGIKDVDDDSREEAALMICSLIILRDGEDVGVYNEQLCKDKIKDWGLEGYEVNGFFQLALISIPAFKQTFDQFISLQMPTE